MKVCIVAHMAYSAVADEATGHIGGVERQTALFSQWLVTHGHEVFVVTWGNDSPEDEIISGINVIKLCQESAGLPLLKFFIPRLSSLVVALNRADADVYFHNCAEDVTGIIAIWCKWVNRPFVYSVASDIDCLPNVPTLIWHERVFYKLGLRNASLVVTQTNYQKELLRSHYKIHGHRIPMAAMPYIKSGDRTPSEKWQMKKVIFVGRIHPVKRIDWFLELATRCSDFRFQIIGPMDNDVTSQRRILKLIERLENVDYLGAILKDKMSHVYQNSSILCCTSEFEGFPNTFLEAWSYGVPVLSTFDPDNLIASMNLGRYAENISQLELGLRDLFSSLEDYTAISKRAKSYVRKTHHRDDVYSSFLKLFQKLTDGRSKDVPVD